MNLSEFNSLVQPDKYQVFLFSSPCSFPISFFSHNWFVTNNRGKIHRFEVWSYKKRVTPIYGHMTIDFYPPNVGTTVLPGSSNNLNKRRFESRLVGSITGDNESLAQSMVDFIENKHTEYPFKFKYHFIPGPNSNTFIQWVLNHFPDSGLKLPRNAFGKNITLVTGTCPS
ncbi:MAG: DUF3750 domain-containing protein [Candidatus Taylorbacteria bacterium]